MRQTPEFNIQQHVNYQGQETIGGIPCTVGYFKEFRWSWMAVQLNTFVIAGTVNGPVTRQVIEDFSEACFRYALKNHKGWPRGLQSAIGSIAILQGTNFLPDAVAFCEKPSKKHWSAFEVPVLYDLNEGHGIRFRQQPLWGKIFFPYFARIIDDFTGRIG